MLNTKVSWCACLVLVSATSVSAQQRERVSYPDGQVPEALRPAVTRAEAGFTALQGSLLRRLQEATRDGAAAALDVCRIEAHAITEHVIREQGIALGRTSHALRNPKNVAPPWAAAFVSSAAGTMAGDHGRRVFDLGATVGVIQPIPMGVLCSNCHGPTESLAGDVRAAIARSYPGDRATGFREGDLRGWIWAEVPKDASR